MENIHATGQPSLDLAKPGTSSPLKSQDGMKPLTSSDQIRVIILLAGSFSDSITCNLSFATLKEPDKSYEALSYEWGLSNPSETFVFIDGSPVSVRQNLYNALLNIRLPDRDRYLWIDALCINQLDPKERGHQVQMMGRIFSSAERVIVWLGAASDSSDKAMDTIHHLGGQESVMINLDLLDSTDTAMDAVPHFEGRHFGVRISADLLKAFLALFTRGYWHRIWVVQEIRLAKEIVWHCGTKSVSGNLLEHAYNFLRNLELSHQTDYSPRRLTFDYGFRARLPVYDTWPLDFTQLKPLEKNKNVGSKPKLPRIGRSIKSVMRFLVHIFKDTYRFETDSNKEESEPVRADLKKVIKKPERETEPVEADLKKVVKEPEEESGAVEVDLKKQNIEPEEALYRIGEYEQGAELQEEMLLTQSINRSIAFSGHIEKKYVYQREYSSFQDWIFHCCEQGFKSTEPRDMVYAILGVCDDLSEDDMLPDYEKEIDEVFIDVVKLCVRRQHAWPLYVINRNRAIQLASKLGIDKSKVPALCEKATSGSATWKWNTEIYEEPSKNQAKNMERWRRTSMNNARP